MKNILNRGIGTVWIIIIIVLAIVILFVLNNKKDDSSTNLPLTENEQEEQQGEEQQNQDEIASCFTSPQSGAIWGIGSTQTITLKNAPINDSHCSNNFSLVDQNNNFVGNIGMSEKGNPSIGWDTSTLYDTSCGTGANLVPVTVGTYKIKFNESDTINGTGQAIFCESDLFTIQ